MHRTGLWVIAGFIALWMIGAAVSLSHFWRPDDTPLDLDETYWIGSAYYYDLAFVQRDWTHPAWKLLPARENPPVSKYILGLGLSVAGHHVTTIDTLGFFYRRCGEIPGGWGVGEDFEKRARVVAATTPGVLDQFHATGLIPVTNEIVQSARTTVMIGALAASFLLLLLGAWTVNWSAGLIASQLILLHPAAIFAYNHAMAEAIALVFSTAAALALYGWLSRSDSLVGSLKKSNFLISGITGVLLAFACAAKMNSLVLVILTAAVFAFAFFHAGKKQNLAAAKKVILLHGLIIAAVTVVTFIVINPAIIRDLMGGLKATVNEHRQTEVIQAQFSPGHLLTSLEKLKAVARLAAWSWIPFSLVTLAAIGCAMISRHKTGIQFLVCWWVIAFFCVIAWIPFAWPRYILPLLAPSALLIGCALSAAVEAVWRRARAVA